MAELQKVHKKFKDTTGFDTDLRQLQKDKI